MQLCLILASLAVLLSFKEIGASGSAWGAGIGNCSADEDDECPLGFYESEEQPSNSSGTFCSCRAGTRRDSTKEIPGIIGCSFANCASTLAPGYWLGYEDSSNSSTMRILTGTCPTYYCHPGRVRLFYQNSTELDELSCGEQNRRGILCGGCKEGYGLSVISPNMSCTPL